MFRHARGYKLANDGYDTRALQHYLGAQEHYTHVAAGTTGIDESAQCADVALQI
jgi:site-specific recombinase XerD